jgi:CheY-like chemotaxis protein
MKTILVVDDSSICLDIVEAWLLDNGYKVLTAKNGKEGYNLCKQHKPDAVILDIEMPDMFGSEVAEAIKTDVSISNTPIIFNTGIIERREIPKDNLISGQYIIAKPFNGDELREILQRVL